MPVQVISQITLGRNNRDIVLVEHPQQPDQPLAVDRQSGQARYNHNIYFPRAHCPNQGKESRPQEAVSPAQIIAGADNFQPLLLCFLYRIQFLRRQPVPVPRPGIYPGPRIKQCMILFCLQ